MSYPNLKQMHIRYRYKNKYHFKCNTGLFRSLKWRIHMYVSTPLFLSSKGIFNNDIERESNRMKGVVSVSIYWVSATISWESHLLRQGVRGKVSMWMAAGARSRERERCDVYEVSANNTSQCKQEAGKKHSDLATRTLNNGHLMGTPQNDKHAAVLPTYLCRVFSLLSVCILFSLSGYVDRERASSRILFWAIFSRIPSKLLHAVRNALAIWVSIFDNYYVHKHCHSKE